MRSKKAIEKKVVFFNNLLAHSMKLKPTDRKLKEEMAWGCKLDVLNWVLGLEEEI